MSKRKIVLGVGGSSGSIYAKRLLDKLNKRGDIEVGLVMSSNAHVNWEMEIGEMNLSEYVHTTVYNNKDFFAPFASGSSSFDTMIICPSSMGLLGRIAAGISNDLMTRGADVMLKERKRLIIVPRETPLNLIHIKNMELLTQAGAIICPATPSFYSKPKTLEEIADTVVDRVLDLANLSDPGSYRWQEG